jgi:peroxiredoxin Q/BCP
MNRLAPGDKAPSFRLKDSFGNEVSLSKLKGQEFILYFYPKDNTPGCTTEACEFSDLKSEFDKLEIKIFGVSADSQASHQKFIKDHNLKITLLMDPNHEVAKAYGAYGEKNNYGKTTLGVIRSTFLIGKDGKIKQAFYNVKAKGHASKVLQDITRK